MTQIDWKLLQAHLRKARAASERRVLLMQERDRAKIEWRRAGGEGPLRMSRAAYLDIDPDYRSEDKHHPSCLVLAPDGATWSVPVAFVSPSD